ncbi:hypothetical protein DYB38_003412 [Aphanomyces astaci]|uniref:PH domain-containing protein n=1 Tax=Aphanomyces astaci TaxID=112090 RepID=A0A397DKG2_APHAT|nr:hypothetical protein DYB38_003412 [Aphanomyces astaci]
MGDNLPPKSVTSPSSLDEYHRASVHQSFSARPTDVTTQPSPSTGVPPRRHSALPPNSMSMGPSSAPSLAGANNAPPSNPLPKSTSSRRSFAFFGFGDKAPSSHSFVASHPPPIISNTGSTADSLADSSLNSSNSSFSMSTLPASMDSSAPSGILASGYLTKRGHVVTNWKTRFFVLRAGGRLSYYADEGMKKKLGEVHLEKVSPWSGEANGFMFYTNKQIAYYVYASTNSERRRWLDALSDFYVEPDAVDCEGCASPCHLVPSYRMRYFVLCGSTIKYYADETAYRSGASALAEMEVRSGGRWDGESTGLFLKTSTGSTLFVCAENVPELQKWLEALARVATDKPMQPIACAGWLTKQGHKRKSWKKRYFVLRGNTLAYYTDFDASNLRHGKPLGEVTVREVSAWDGEPSGFMFITNDSVPYYVFADNDRDQAKWLAALRKLFESATSMEEPDKTCPRCAYVLTGSRFCGACGFNLRGTSNERSRQSSQPLVVPSDDFDNDDENSAMDDLDALSEGARTLLLAVMQNPSIQLGDQRNTNNSSNPNLVGALEQEIMDALEMDDDEDVVGKQDKEVTPPAAAGPSSPVVTTLTPAPSIPPTTTEAASPAATGAADSPSQPAAAPGSVKSEASSSTTSNESAKSAPRVSSPPPPAPRQSTSARKDFVVPASTTNDTSFSSFGSDVDRPVVKAPGPFGKAQQQTIADLLHDSSDEEKDDDKAAAATRRSQLFELKGSARQFDTLPPNDDAHLNSPQVDASPRPSMDDSLVLVGVAGLKEDTTTAVVAPAVSKPDPQKDLYMFMEREMQFTPLFVPSADAPVRCRLYASMAYSTSKKILLFLTDSGPLGLWKDDATTSDAPVDVHHPFAMLPYLHRAQQEGFSLIVCNPFSNSAKVFEQGGVERVVPIPQSATPKEHLFFVWETFVMPTKAEISVVAYHRGGALAVSLLDKFEDARRKIFRIAFIESKHIVNRDTLGASVLEFLGRRTIQWEASVDQPAGGQIVDAQERVGCVCLSLGATDNGDVGVLDKAEDAVFAFLMANPTRPGMTAIVKQVRSALRISRRGAGGSTRPPVEKSAMARGNSNVFVLGEADGGHQHNHSDSAIPAADSPDKPSPHFPYAQLAMSLGFDYSDEEILCRGYLTKRGHVVTNWKMRYFVLRPHASLSYYEDESMAKKLGQVHLAKVAPWEYNGSLAKSVSKRESRGSSSGAEESRYGFMFFTTKRVVYYIYTTSAIEHQKWFHAVADYYVHTSNVADCEGYMTKKTPGTLFSFSRPKYVRIFIPKMSEDAYRSHEAPISAWNIRAASRWEDGLSFQGEAGAMLFLSAPSEADQQRWMAATQEKVGSSLQPIACAGYLTKQGHKRKSWKRRYFVLRGSLLSYYTDYDSTNKQCLAEVGIEDVQVWDGEMHGFMFTTSEQVVYYVYAESERERQKWLGSLKALLDAQSTRAPKPLAMGPPPVSKVCPKCRHMVTGSKFCGNCGHHVDVPYDDPRPPRTPPRQPPQSQPQHIKRRDDDDEERQDRNSQTLLISVMQATHPGRSLVEPQNRQIEQQQQVAAKPDDMMPEDTTVDASVDDELAAALEKANLPNEAPTGVPSPRSNQATHNVIVVRPSRMADDEDYSESEDEQHPNQGRRRLTNDSIDEDEPPMLGDDKGGDVRESSLCELVMDGIVVGDEGNDKRSKMETYLEHTLGFDAQWVPSREAKASCRFYTSKNYNVAADVLVFLGDSGKVGIWKDETDTIDDPTSPMSMLPYVEAALKLNFGVVLCNPHHNTVDVRDGPKIRTFTVQQSASPAEHLHFVWTNYIAANVLPTTRVGIVAAGRAGKAVITLMQDEEATVYEKLNRVAFLQSTHAVDSSLSMVVLECLGRRAINWEGADGQALCSQVVNSQSRVGCVCMATGFKSANPPDVASMYPFDLTADHLKHMQVPIFAYLTANPAAPGMTAIVKHMRSTLKKGRSSSGRTRAPPEAATPEPPQSKPPTKPQRTVSDPSITQFYLPGQRGHTGAAEMGKVCLTQTIVILYDCCWRRNGNKPARAAATSVSRTLNC